MPTTIHSGLGRFKMSGQPSMSVPLVWSKAGLPLGMLFSTYFGDEATLFRLATQLEQAAAPAARSRWCSARHSKIRKSS